MPSLYHVYILICNTSLTIIIFQTAAISIGSFILSWSPYAAIALLGMMSTHENRMLLHPLMSEIPVVIAKASAAYNPIIYAFRSEITLALKHIHFEYMPHPTALYSLVI